MAYGTIARCKTDWLNITDIDSDTQLTQLLETANRKMDNALTPYLTVPITSPADFVQRIAEQWTSGLYLQAAAKSDADYNRGKDMEDRAKKDLDVYIGTVSKVGLVTVLKDYLTEPIGSG